MAAVLLDIAVLVAGGRPRHQGLLRRAKPALEDVIGTPPKRVRDPRPAATVLMIQLVRAGSPVTAPEKTHILEAMEAPLGIENVSGAFERAWARTQVRRPFSIAADKLLPLRREAITQLRRQVRAPVREGARAPAQIRNLCRCPPLRSLTNS